MMYQISNDTLLTHFTRQDDEFSVTFNPNNTAKNSQIINLIIPSASQDFFSIKAGDKSMRLCFVNKMLCYRTRVIALVSKFPGAAAFSKYRPVLSTK